MQQTTRSGWRSGAHPATAFRGTVPRGRRPVRLFLHEVGGLLRLAVPIIVSQLGQVGMNTADTIMVGPLGATPLAAAGLGSALHTFATILCTGIILGMAPLVSQAFGAGDRERCRKVLVQGLWISIGLTLPVVWFSLAGGGIATALGQEAAVAELAGGYMSALAWGVAPLFLFMAFRQFLEGMGIATPTMVMTFLGLGINIVANRIFIYGVGDWIPAMGVVGSGWATTIVRWAMLAAMAVYLVRHPGLRPFHQVRIGPDRATLGRIMAIGGPIGAQFGLEVGLFSLAAVMMGWLGPLELAAHQVTINIAATTFMVALGVSLAGSVRIGQHIGAGRRRAVRRATLGTYLLAVGFMAICALVFLLFPERLIGLYTDDAPIIALGTRLLLVAALFQIFDGAQVAGVSALRGAADTRTPMLLAAAGYWGIGIPVAMLLAFRSGLGPLGIWIGLSAGLACVAAFLVFRVRRVLWRIPPTIGAPSPAAAGGG